MIKYSDITKSVADQAVDTAKLVQERIVETFEAFEPVTEQFSSMLPGMPDMPKLPIVEALPSFSDIVEANAALVERVVKANKDLAIAVAKAVPTFEKVEAV
jgi:hypothetical protein